MSLGLELFGDRTGFLSRVIFLASTAAGRYIYLHLTWRLGVWTLALVLRNRQWVEPKHHTQRDFLPGNSHFKCTIVVREVSVSLISDDMWFEYWDPSQTTFSTSRLHVTSEKRVSLVVSPVMSPLSSLPSALLFSHFAAGTNVLSGLVDFWHTHESGEISTARLKVWDSGQEAVPGRQSPSICFSFNGGDGWRYNSLSYSLTLMTGRMCGCTSDSLDVREAVGISCVICKTKLKIVRRLWRGL